AVPLRRAVHEAAGTQVADDVRPAVDRILRQLHGRGQPRASIRRGGLVDVRSGTAVSGDLKIYYEDMGDIDDPPVLLIMGLGAQLVLWRTTFCEKLVNQGLRVIRYDNRDIGLSSKTEHRSTGQPVVVKLLRSWLGLRSRTAYTLE